MTKKGNSNQSNNKGKEDRTTKWEKIVVENECGPKNGTRHRGSRCQLKKPTMLQTVNWDPSSCFTCCGVY